MKRVCVTLDARTLRLLDVLGEVDGEKDRSRGVRVAAEMAYEQWQKK